MKSLKDINEVNKIIKMHLAMISSIKPNDIRNAETMYGASLLKVLEKKKANSYSLDDCVLLFAVHTRNNSADTLIVNNGIDYYKSYQIDLICYGNNSINEMNSIYAQFQTDYILSKLLVEGINVEQITHPSEINEFINNVRWPRTDMQILINCKHSFTEKYKYDDFETISNLKIIN